MKQESDGKNGCDEDFQRFDCVWREVQAFVSSKHGNLINVSVNWKRYRCAQTSVNTKDIAYFETLHWYQEIYGLWLLHTISNSICVERSTPAGAKLHHNMLLHRAMLSTFDGLHMLIHIWNFLNFTGRSRYCMVCILRKFTLRKIFLCRETGSDLWLSVTKLNAAIKES